MYDANRLRYNTLQHKHNVSNSNITSKVIHEKDTLTHWGRGKIAAICRRHFQMHFPEWKYMNFDSNFIELKFQLFLRIQLTIFQHWSGLWLGAGQVTSHYLITDVSLSFNELIHKSFHSSSGSFGDVCTAKYKYCFLYWRSWITLHVSDFKANLTCNHVGV